MHCSPNIPRTIIFSSKISRSVIAQIRKIVSLWWVSQTCNAITWPDQASG